MANHIWHTYGSYGYWKSWKNGYIFITFLIEKSCFDLRWTWNIFGISWLTGSSIIAGKDLQFFGSNPPVTGVSMAMMKYPKWMVYFMEDPIVRNGWWLGVPLFVEPPHVLMITPTYFINSAIAETKKFLIPCKHSKISLWKRMLAKSQIQGICFFLFFAFFKCFFLFMISFHFCYDFLWFHFCFMCQFDFVTVLLWFHFILFIFF